MSMKGLVRAQGSSSAMLQILGIGAWAVGFVRV